MALPIYLAMTAWEMANRETPGHCGWMACHFSPYSPGLSNIPRQLPEDSLLIVNDRIPNWGHDPNLITAQLQETVEKLKPRGILWDLQRPYEAETAKIVQAASSLSCPMAVTEPYAKDLSGAVFLPPVPPNRTLEQHISQWANRDIWLEAACTGLTMTLTKDGCTGNPGAEYRAEPVFSDDALHCRYCFEVQQAQAVFSLWREKEDISALLEEAGKMGVTLAVGLYQELSPVLFVHGSA